MENAVKRMLLVDAEAAASAVRVLKACLAQGAIHQIAKDHVRALTPQPDGDAVEVPESHAEVARLREVLQDVVNALGGIDTSLALDLQDNKGEIMMALVAGMNALAEGRKARTESPLSQEPGEGEIEDPNS